jgi:hypothetical protein
MSQSEPNSYHIDHNLSISHCYFRNNAVELRALSQGELFPFAAISVAGRLPDGLPVIILRLALKKDPAFKSPWRFPEAQSPACLTGLFFSRTAMQSAHRPSRLSGIRRSVLSLAAKNIFVR